MTVSLPAHRFAPLDWAVRTVLEEVLGLPIKVECTDRPDIILSAEGREIRLHSCFPDLDAPREAWASQMPQIPLKVLERGNLPVLFGAPVITREETRTTCEVDIFGAIFFMLSRFEEVVLPDRDGHDRFPAAAALAGREGFLQRPIVDEYAALLFSLMQEHWPQMRRRVREGRTRISCDVDQPFDRVGRNPKALIRGLGGDLLRRKSPRTAARRALNFWTHGSGDHRHDPFYTFDWYMDVCEQNGHRAAFYFIPDHSGGAIDGDYDISDLRILRLMQSIHARGHEIGMHGSFNTYQDPGQIRHERTRLTEALARAGLEVEILGNRQHYLRWDSAQTPDHLEACGFAYDTSGAFPDRPGFRYGTSQPFAMWSWTKRAPLKLRQHPLVLMECSVLSPGYLGMGHGREATDLMQSLKRAALRHGGDFTLLWHNSHLLTKADRACFRSLVQT
ncbi:MarR family transcriptional regulator [Pelagicola sp. LXJ1103]|nr:MarR family transcriptional regulator [Pelagicola sp. LXJ1103]